MAGFDLSAEEGRARYGPGIATAVTKHGSVPPPRGKRPPPRCSPARSSLTRFPRLHRVSRPTEADLPRTMCFPRVRRRGPAGAPCGPGVEVQAAAHDSRPPRGRGGAAHHGLVGRGLRAVRRAVRVEVVAGRWIRDVARRHRCPRLRRRLAARLPQSTVFVYRVIRQ